MSANSKIEWTDATWNPVRARLLTSTGLTKIGTHCEHVSEGCRFCYAETFNRRGLPNAGTGLDYKPGHRDKLQHFLDEKMLLAPLRRKKPTRYFLSSLTDVFGPWVTDDMLDQLFAVMALCPQHVFQVLTKRPERAREYMAHVDMTYRVDCLMDELINERIDPLNRRSDDLRATAIDIDETWPLPNVWLGTSVEDQAAADARIPHLLATPAEVRFLSCEPLLGPVDLRRIPQTCSLQHHPFLIDALTGTHRDADNANELRMGWSPINWVIVGGESGPGARPMHPDWARSLRDQCAAANVPFFFKQWGVWKAYLDRDNDDPDWRFGYGRIERSKSFCMMNLAGGSGFHGERLHVFQRIDKKTAGRLLDGIEHNGVPT
jgi:protein gp37